MDGGDKHSGDNTEKPEGDWQYKPDSAGAVPEPSASQPTASPRTPDDTDQIDWTASEFVAHHKGAGWYIALALIGFLIASGVYILTRDVFSVLVIGTLAGIVGVAANRQPRVMEYRLDRSGLAIGRRFHPYGEFKSFSVIDEGVFSNITFMPMKRFIPPVSIYFSPEDERRIIEVLSRHLPMQPAPHDALDTVLRRIRF